MIFGIVYRGQLHHMQTHSIKYILAFFVIF